MLGSSPLSKATTPFSNSLASKPLNPLIDIFTFDMSNHTDKLESAKDKPKKTMTSSAGGSESNKEKESQVNKNVIVHQVTMTDTFMSLSIKYGVSAEEIRKLNKIMPGTRLFSLKEVQIPVNHNSSANLESSCKSTSLSSKTLHKKKSGQDWLLEQVAEHHKEESKTTSNRCRDFFKRIDQRLTQFKSESKAIKPSASIIKSTSTTSSTDDCDVENVFTPSLMSTYLGKERAEDQALSQIERILLMDEDVINSPPPPSIQPEQATDAENDLVADTDVYGL